MVMVQCFVILEVYSAGLVHETETIDTTKGFHTGVTMDPQVSSPGLEVKIALKRTVISGCDCIGVISRECK